MGGTEQLVTWGLLLGVFLLPSIVLYGFLAWSIVHFVRRREALYLLVALAPFAWWAFAVVVGSYTKAQAEKELAAEVATVPPPAELPDTIVFEGKVGFPKPVDVRKYFGFRYAVYVRNGSKRGQSPRLTILRYDLRDRHAMKPDELQALPGRYVVFRAKDASARWNDGQPKAADGGPFEMHYVDGRRDDLIGFYYRRFVPVPAFPPILTLGGWSFGGNSIGSKDLRGLMLEFMSSSLRRT
jgi:hypothetical protein